MAKDIFDKTIFDGYRVESLTESAQDIIPKYNFDGSTKTTVFISHKHDDLDEIKGLIGLLERKYNIKAYIDSLDKSMPKKTSGETASKIKQRINRCNKFILLATNGAVESKTYKCKGCHKLFKYWRFFLGNLRELWKRRVSRRFSCIYICWKYRVI